MGVLVTSFTELLDLFDPGKGVGTAGLSWHVQIQKQSYELFVIV